MTITRIDHIQLVVKDLARSLEFYGDILGLKQLSSVNLGNHILHYFLISSNQRLELNEYLYPTRDSVSELKDRGTWRHLAFEVSDAFAVEKLLEEHGYHFHMPVALDEALHVYSGLVLDPNGVELEFLQHIS